MIPGPICAFPKPFPWPMLWFSAHPESQPKRSSRMNAITQLRPDSPGSPDLLLFFAAVEAFPGSLAVVDSGVVIYANPAWAQMFEYVDPMQIRGRALEEFIPRP